MKKAAIITLNGYKNYGNRLQNYATQEIIKSFGFEVETIIYDSKPDILNNKVSKFSKIKSLSFEKIYNKFKTVNERINNKMNRNLIRKRTNLFKDFSKEFLIETNFTISESDIPEDLPNKYDYFVTGSDQVWNPYNMYGGSIYFLSFAPKTKRIALAPSFGVYDIPSNRTKEYSVWLSEMKGLSVREEAGAKIIKDLTDRDATVLVDPTLILPKEKWLSISKIPSNKPINKFLVTYFLGNVSKERMEYIKSLAKKNNLAIVNLAQIKDKEAYLTGPSEFIDYINTASVVLTDSFHGAVFSILMETPFIVFSRDSGKGAPSMNSRIDTLLSTFKLESRLFTNVKSNDQVFEINYSHIPPILESERNKVLDYLNDAFK